MSGRNNCHRHHPELPHSDFPRVKSGQRLLQRLGPESLNAGNGVGRLAVEAWREGAGGTDTVGVLTLSLLVSLPASPNFLSGTFTCTESPEYKLISR